MNEFLGTHPPGRVVLGHYTIVRLLASGGQGVVYLARKEGVAGFVRPVVIKQVLSHLMGLEQRVRQLAREGRILAHLSHPGIVNVIDFGEQDGSYFLVLEYVHGFTLGQWLRYVLATRGEFPVDLAVWAILQVLDALHYGHTLEADGRSWCIVHRDVSPSNVLINQEGHVKVTDFGIANMTSDHSQNSTDTYARDGVKGKLAYMAPDLLSGVRPSPGTDVYACGVMLHELIRGENELLGPQVSVTAFRALNHVPTPLHEWRAEVGRPLSDVVARSVAKEPEQRFRDAREMATALRSVTPEEQGELVERFTATVRRDFADPVIAEHASGITLDTLDRAWRVKPPRVQSTQASALGRYRGWWLWALPLCVVLGLGAWRMASLRTPAGAEVVYVQSDVVQRQDVVTGVGTDLKDASPEQVPVRASPDSRAAAFTRTFARRGPQVNACFARHGQGVRGLTVKFSVLADGTVERVVLRPARLASTPLGACIERIALQTNFGPLRRGVSFQIPLEAPP